MPKNVYFSFHFERDVHRVQLVRNINALEGQPLLNSQTWEEVQKSGDSEIEKWIKSQMKGKSTLIVLSGAETAGRKWVNFEINYAWNNNIPIIGVKIHGLSSMGKVDFEGRSPFAVGSGIPLFDPTVKLPFSQQIDSSATYNSLVSNLVNWSEKGKKRS